jgi:hypothetical protein
MAFLGLSNGTTLTLIQSGRTVPLKFNKNVLFICKKKLLLPSNPEVGRLSYKSFHILRF